MAEAPRAGGKLCPKIILEGTRLTHKTDLAFALNEHSRIVGPRACASSSCCATTRGSSTASTSPPGPTSAASAAATSTSAGSRNGLLPLGFRLVLCTRRPETFAAARRARLEVDVSGDDVPLLADRIADWLAATGGLRQEDPR